jgi:hypothetical protein
MKIAFNILAILFMLVGVFCIAFVDIPDLKICFVVVEFNLIYSFYNRNKKNVA